MAIPKSLKLISRDKAQSIVKRHREGEWEGAPWNSDFVYVGRCGRMEMIRAFTSNVYNSTEHGVVSL